MYSKYQVAIKAQLDLKPEEWSFKSVRNYTDILEHVNNSLGEQYLHFIETKFKTFYESNIGTLKNLCTLNDKYGKTHKYPFKNFMTCSPTNLRYILHTLLILEDIKKYKLNSVDFIEIGGGYGGLCFFIHKIASLYKININSYSIFDLLEPSLLQMNYLKALNVNNVNFCQLNNFNHLRKNSFLISNYAFSEISIELQREYIEKIINPYTSYGFLAWNYIPIYDFVKNCIIEKEKEYPQTGNGKNYFVRYYPKDSPNV